MWLPKYCRVGNGPAGLVVCSGDAGGSARHYDASQRGDRRDAGHGRRAARESVRRRERRRPLRRVYIDRDESRRRRYQRRSRHLRPRSSNRLDHTRERRAGWRPGQRGERGAIDQRRRKIRRVSVGGDKPGRGRHERACRLLCPRQADRRHDASQRGDRWCTGDGWAPTSSRQSAQMADSWPFTPARRIWSRAIPTACRTSSATIARPARRFESTWRLEVRKPSARAASGLSSAAMGDSSGSTRGLPTLFPAIPMVCPMCSSTTSRLRPRRGSVSVRAERRQTLRAWSGRSATMADSSASSRSLPI